MVPYTVPFVNGYLKTPFTYRQEFEVDVAVMSSVILTPSRPLSNSTTDLLNKIDIGLTNFLIYEIFLNRKMDLNKKLPTEKDMLNQLKSGNVELLLPALRFSEKELRNDESRRFDALVEASWDGIKAKFAVECKALSTPKAFQDGLNFIKTSPPPKGYQPLLYVPFFNERQLQELEREGISGIDLCGNMVVIVPGKFSVFRSGGQNRFRFSDTIKNIYRRNSSMVGRVFLVHSSYNAVQDVWSEINRRDILIDSCGRVPTNLSTVSKALKTLAEDLVIERSGAIRLLQPDKLLDKLSENYIPPKIKQRVQLKITENTGMLQKLLQKEAKKVGVPLVATGISSVMRYAVMQQGDMISIYCPRLETLLERMPGSQTDRFPNLELIETEDATVYFDARQNEGFWWASPVQVYLELMAGDKRDREIAVQVRLNIINAVQKVGQ